MTGVADPGAGLASATDTGLSTRPGEPAGEEWPPAAGQPERSAARWYRWQPPAHWVVFGLTTLVLVLALLLQGYARHEVGRSSTAGAGPVVQGLADARPVLDLSGPDVRSARLPDRTVALTFDDGPDPKWTPAILGVLRRHGVPATFFVVGAHALAHPNLVRTELAQGDEVGSHTFTHADLGALPRWRANIELSLTETALAGVARINTSLLRLPYSSVPSALSVSQYRAARNAARYGYLLVLATNDTEDWRRPGAAAIVARALPQNGAGAVVMLHDSGGDRSQTVAAVDQLITLLTARGYTFTTVSRIAGLPARSADVPVTASAHWQGVGLLWSVRIAIAITNLLVWLLVPIGLLSLCRAVLLAWLARRHARGTQTEGPAPLPPVSVVVPAFNEEVGIAATLASLVASDYPEFEVIVVDDGSTDGTAEAIARLGLPGVTLVRQANAGKPAALNAGVARARNAIIVMVDGDTLFEPDTLRWLVRPLADPAIGAVSGNTKVGNRRRLLGRWQHIEYVLGFNLDRRMYDILRCMPTVPGAVGAFRRDVLEAVGGVSDDTLAEDTDLTMAINRAGWRVTYEERARAWTEAPASLGALWRQRYRWSYGTMQAMWKHRGAIRERSPLGRIGLPYLLAFQIVLPLLAPAIDLFALYGILFLNPAVVAAYWMGFNALQLALGWYAFRLDHESPRPLWAVPLQQFVYRQLMYLVVIQSVVSAVSGTQQRWHKLRRLGGVEVLPRRG